MTAVFGNKEESRVKFSRSGKEEYIKNTFLFVIERSVYV